MNIVHSQLEQHMEINDNFVKLENDPRNLTPAFTYLLSVKADIPSELYAYYLRKLYTMTTNGVSKELVLRLFDNVRWEDIMYDEELDEIKQFPEYIKIFRGTSKSEIEPRTSWTIKRYVAEEFSEGRIMETVISKKDILLYVSKYNHEYEIVANVTGEVSIYDD